MALVITLNLLVVVTLLFIAFSRGYAATLPVAAAMLVVFPTASQIPLPGLFDLTTQRIVVLVLAGLYLYAGRAECIEEEARPLPLRYLLLGLILWMLLSSAHSVVPMISFKATLSQCFDFCLLYFVFARSVRTRAAAEKVLGGFVAGMVICACFGLLEIYGGWKIISLLPEAPTRFAALAGLDESRGSRVQSTFDHAILFGAALSLAIPMVFHLLARAQTVSRRAYLWFAASIMMLCVYKTSSRGPWLALALSLLFLLALGAGPIRKSLVALACIVTIGLILRPGIRESIGVIYGATLDRDSPMGESYQWRYVLYDVARRELARSFERSAWGYGPESFYYLGISADTYVDGEEHTVNVESCDSAVVALMVETGYVGLLIVCALLIAAAFAALRQHFKDLANGDSLAIVLFVNICAFSFMMTNVALFGWGQQSYMLWIILAIAMNIRMMESAGLRQDSNTGVLALSLSSSPIAFHPH